MHAEHLLRKSTRLLNVPDGHMHRVLNVSADDELEVTVPSGHGEHCVHRLMDVSVTSTSLLLDQIMIFHTAERKGCM